ncbi:hypothetical protein Syun_015310 [Stephania yunnanensis]|uniref:Uncharacterized protein n=1 Tax=Stephania yunnanensis TaxID=152371 RepID=A0AAP0JLS9_9MAGN
MSHKLPNARLGEVEGSTHVGVKLLVSYQKEIVADSSGYSLYVLLSEVVVCSSNSNCCCCSSMNIISRVGQVVGI